VDALQDPRLREIVEKARRENRKAKQRRREAVKRARRFLPELVRAFRRIDPDIGTIVLFGSLAEGTVRGEHFDIDIAVRSGRYLQLVAWALDQSFKIDVLDLDAARPHLAERIRSGGEVLYGGKERL
jgi:predicted nucleotidyltransferase